MRHKILSTLLIFTIIAVLVSVLSPQVRAAITDGAADIFLEEDVDESVDIFGLKLRDISIEYHGSYSPFAFVESVNESFDVHELDYSFKTEEMGQYAEAGTYSITIVASDREGNSDEETCLLTIDQKPGPPSDTYIYSANASASEQQYYVQVNRAANCVTIYEKDENGNYRVPVKSMLCSTGSGTPLGVYNIGDRYPWRELVGYVYGQYSTRIVGNILFHSVPYLEMSKETLEYEEFNKLGTSASLGCVRLSVEDAKWIYDNCAEGTIVEIFDDENDPGPLGRPEATIIDANSDYRGWDPTDPDPENPWHTAEPENS